MQTPVVAAVEMGYGHLRATPGSLTAIPHLYPYRGLSAPTLQVRSLHRLIVKGLGRRLVNRVTSAR